jgi:hypothetical protein
LLVLAIAPRRSPRQDFETSAGFSIQWLDPTGDERFSAFLAITPQIFPAVPK